MKIIRDGTWVEAVCDMETSFICTNLAVNGVGHRTLILTKTLLRYPTLHFLWTHSPETNNNNITAVANGLKFSWEIVNGSLTLPDAVTLESKDLTGSVSTPGLGTIPPPNYHKERHEYTVVMELTDNITEVIGDDALVIDLDVTIPDNEAGEVQILTTEPHLELNQKSMNWTSAEAFCLSKGGHLESVSSPYDWRKLEAFIDKEGIREQFVWLGGTDEKNEGKWAWSDGSERSEEHWDFDNRITS